jgi:hypothetical protein
MSRVMTFVAAAALAPALAAQIQTGTVQLPAGSASVQGPGVPPRDAQPPKTGTARIRGHVFGADTGQPLRKVLIRAFSAELRENRVVSTDAQGAYELTELPAGRYSLNASKGSYVALSYGQVRPFEVGKPLEILDGQTVEKVDFSLPRGAVITGHIFDEFGEPIADVQVAPMRYAYIQGQRRLMPTGRMGSTNDIGEYRMFGLPPGQYYISATFRSNMSGFAESDDRSGYAPTYYPGTGNVADAQRVTLGIGQTLSDVNLTLVPARTARIRGTAVSSEGRPITNAYVMAMQRQTGGAFMGFGANGGQVRPDGSFSVGGLAPGDYFLQVNTGGSGPGGTAEFASAVVSVGGEDVDGVRLVTAKMSLGTGRIVVDGTAPSQRLSAIQLMTSPVHPDDFMMGGGGATVKDDLTFELRARPGLLAIRLAGTFPDLSLKAVRLNGQDVTDTGIEFKPNEDVNGIEVEVTTKVSQVSGLVTDNRGETAKDYTVIVFARDREKWAGSSRYVSIGRPDQDGRFKIRSLPAGEYYAAALEYVEPGEASDPEFLDRIKTKAITLSLGDGETRTLDLKLSSST